MWQVYPNGRFTLMAVVPLRQVYPSGMCTLVFIHTFSDRIITAQNVFNMLHILLDFLIYMYEFCSNCLFLNIVSQ